MALAAVYAHPAEVATSNALPLVLTPLLLHCHLFTVVIWFVLAVVGSQLHHCGYSCGLSAPPQSGLLRFVVPVPQPEFHDWHHERGGGPNGGWAAILDSSAFWTRCTAPTAAGGKASPRLTCERSEV